MVSQNRVLKIDFGSIHNVGQILSENQIVGKILYVSDKLVDSIYGNSVKTQLKEIGQIQEEFVDNNTIAYAMSLAERILTTSVSCIVGMGGGKVLDVCKYAAYISKKPFVSLPTTLTNDGIASPIAVLKGKNGKPNSLGCAMPSMLILDTEIVMQSPVHLIKAGIGDTISNYMALLDWELACVKGKDVMNGYANLMSRTALDALIKTRHNSINADFIRVLANSLVLSGVAMDFTGSSRPVSGSEHLFSHALDYYADLSNLHGLQVALGTVAMLKLTERSCDEVIQYIHRFEIGLNPKMLNISEDNFVYCLQNARMMRPERYTYLDEIDLSETRCKKVYKELLEEL